MTSIVPKTPINNTSKRKRKTKDTFATFFTKTRVSCTVGIPAFFCSQERYVTGIASSFSQQLMKFVDDFNGVLLAFNNIELLDRNFKILLESGQAIFKASVALDLLLFQPRVNELVDAVVSRMSPDHVTFLLYGVFKVVVANKQMVGYEFSKKTEAGVVYNEWCQRGEEPVRVGQTFRIFVERVDVVDALVELHGTLDEKKGAKRVAMQPVGSVLPMMPPVTPAAQETEALNPYATQTTSIFGAQQTRDSDDDDDDENKTDSNDGSKDVDAKQVEKEDFFDAQAQAAAKKVATSTKKKRKKSPKKDREEKQAKKAKKEKKKEKKEKKKQKKKAKKA